MVKIEACSSLVLLQADELCAKAHSDHILVQNELKKTEQDAEGEKASLEQEVLAMKNKLTEKL